MYMESVGFLVVFNNSFILQYGFITRQGTYTTVTFPLTYAKYNSVVLTHHLAVDNNVQLVRYLQQKTLTNFKIHTYGDGSTSDKFSWIATGF